MELPSSISAILNGRINSKFLILLNEKTGKYKLSFRSEDVNSHPDDIMVLVSAGNDYFGAFEDGGKQSDIEIFPIDNILKIKV